MSVRAVLCYGFMEGLAAGVAHPHGGHRRRRVKARNLSFDPNGRDLTHSGRHPFRLAETAA
jgi:hypothetical protein